MRTSFLTLLLAGSINNGLIAQNPAIHLNQIGFYPAAPKIAVIAPSTAATRFYVLEQTSGDTVFKGQLGPPRPNPLSGKSSQIADFSTLSKPGKYQIALPDGVRSYTFKIGTAVHHDLAIGALKSYYFQRMSTELPATFAGPWARTMGHPDRRVLVHPSAATFGRPPEFVISAPGGWYDAGDYNKYIVNSGITTATLLSLYEDFPQYCQQLKTNIPESGNQIPDLLDEVLWNLRWMLKMQDPDDGGVYHKLTNPSFDPLNMMPGEAIKPRYVVKKTSAAALNLAAVAAQAARVFRPLQKQLPGLADSCLQVARKAWDWALLNPATLYNQNELNKNFDPDIVTGAYDDRVLEDEWLWAASELYLSTRETKYLERIRFDQALRVPSWNQVACMATCAWARASKVNQNLQQQAIRQLQTLADTLLKGLDRRPYHTVMGKKASDFVWGSSGVAANQALVLLQVYRLSKNSSYLEGALHNLDYLLGRNATGYCFVTGFGQKSPQHIHHRLSEADGVEAPVPGLLSGGPNPGKQDQCPGYPSNAPDECFLDEACSYASNEIAINWNAPLVYLTVAIEALAEKAAFKKKK